MEPDDRGLFQTRGHACEIVAWRFLTHLSEPELIEYLLYDLPGSPSHETQRGPFDSDTPGSFPPDERSGLLRGAEPARFERSMHEDGWNAEHATNREEQPLAREEDDPTLVFAGLNALEIAAVADAKHFLSQRVVQKTVNGIWRGDIVFWNSLNVHTVKNAQYYNKRYVKRGPALYVSLCFD